MTAARGSNSVDTSGIENPQRLEFEVPADTRSVGEARHAVTTFLVAREVPTAIVDDIELATSELVTNAVLHPVPSEHDVKVYVEVDTHVTLTVANHGPMHAIPPVACWSPAPPNALSGRGLGIVRRITDEAGVRQDGSWTVVSCARRLPGGRAAE
ncbi:MAG: ATP-binding protein [Ilumatobacteraceae bacterium]